MEHEVGPGLRSIWLFTGKKPSAPCPHQRNFRIALLRIWSHGSGFFSFSPELGRLLLYVGIGLFLGRAARETQGIAIPWLFHFLITAAIWTLITLRS